MAKYQTPEDAAIERLEQALIEHLAEKLMLRAHGLSQAPWAALATSYRDKWRAKARKHLRQDGLLL